MGKYTKKSKITAEVPLVDVSRHSSVALGGVRTRAKTLALRRLRMNTTLNPIPSSSSSSSCYLELRSRRLHKPPRAPIKPRNHLPRPKQCSRVSRGFHSSCGDERDGSSVASSRTDPSCSAAAVSRNCEGHLGRESRTERGDSEESFGGENSLEPDEQTERRASSSMARRLIQGDDVISCGIPTAPEMEEFFALAEQEQRSLFTEKYNFDVLTDSPLPGRFEWARVRP